MAEMEDNVDEGNLPKRNSIWPRCEMGQNMILITLSTGHGSARMTIISFVSSLCFSVQIRFLSIKVWCAFNDADASFI